MKLKAGQDVIAALRLAYRADKPALLEGLHGIGKSELVQETAHSLDID